MKSLSNVEFMLLQIIAESKQASGYQINKLIELRGYREWANIGTTSIYVGLQKLKDKELIQSEDSVHKSGKGPVPSTYVMMEAGIEALRNEVIVSLASARERDNRFDLGLAALPFIGKNQAVEALWKRQNLLEETLRNLGQKYESQGGNQLPLHVRSLFLHPMSLIENEKTFVANLISELTGELEVHAHDN
ncbi:helix-turn-helix transcriptional regulator [Paenibacillus sp. UMB4589-SE434]|uniref:helix-turn-helix transcriptional regulator n=1 Tax=Paenibacillus sp. UMB4589-SE434 TaxID=3046314 RepID=UPI00254CDB16|nr:helix-turn-helix transcriptional regulator [Paenibacillus sp. UMB4589-SE434]MDK8184050.1 helix-turn-helix transcriptional regulator [Paenibacillus sp. UMB4589-SE434]